jgi:PAS domain-containing protein
MWSAASVMLALMHLLLWLKGRPSPVYLLSSLMAVSAGASAMIELMLLQSSSIEPYSALLRWENLSVFSLLMSMVWFVYFVYLHFGTARRWLAATVTALWSVAIVINFTSPHSVVFADVQELRPLPTFWGESFTVALGPANPWVTLTNLASTLILVYVVDASIRLWRQGKRQRAGLIGGSIVLFMVAAGIHTPLVDSGIVETPYMTSFAFLAVVLAMSSDLVSDAVKVSRYARLIEASEARWRTLLENVQLAVIGVDPAGRISYTNPFLVSLTGFPKEGLVGRSLADLIPPSDVPELRRRLAQAAETGPRPHSHWVLGGLTQAADAAGTCVIGSAREQGLVELVHGLVLKIPVDDMADGLDAGVDVRLELADVPGLHLVSVGRHKLHDPDGTDRTPRFVAQP